MKKIYIYLICAVLTFSCSLGGFSLNSLPTLTPPPTLTKTYTPVPTVTPITPTVTFTFTPTMVGMKSPTPSQEISETPVISVTPFALITPNTITPTFEMKGFVSISISEKEFYKGDQCQPSSVKLIVQVADPVKATIVDVFVRLKNKHTDATGEWTRITMKNIGAGTFTHDLTSADLKSLYYFHNDWVQYQFVASTDQAREAGRTAIFKEALTLLDCVLTPTPSLTPTPTLLKP